MLRPGALRRTILLVGVGVAVWAALATSVRATRGAQTTADEPQYLLSALSLWEDRDLDIGDELADQRWRDFHEVRLPVQTEPLDDGRVLSPHDPLLPAILAVPVGLGGWVGAKLALAAIAGVLAGLLVWIAVVRLDVPVRLAGLVVAGFGVVSPLVAYGTQVYPELPAALAVAAALAALLGPFESWRSRAVAIVAIVALPWLGVKYLAVAAALAIVALWSLWRRPDRRPALAVAGTMALAGLAYIVAHRVLYGGWTVYNAGDHFSAEHTVVGYAPDYLGRSRRLVGLLLDRGFGLAAWAPAFLLVVPAAAAAARRRPPWLGPLALTFAAGWATATWLALTMHGWWWPGRQTVVVLPCAVLAVAWWAAQERRAIVPFAALSLAGVAMWGWLVLEGWQERINLVVTFEQTRDPLYRAWRGALPDFHHSSASTWWLTALWLVLLAGAAAWSWRAAATSRLPATDRHPQPPNNRRSAHVVA